jgi:spermidine synthase
MSSTPHEHPGRLLGLTLWLAFFASGMAALVYEIVWTYLLGLVFGVTYLAIATVVAVFMGGMAAGALVAGRWVDRGLAPLLVFLVAESVLALSGLAIPYLLPTVQAAFVGIVHATEPGVLGRTLIQLLLCSGLLAVPAVAMGATLPALTRQVVGRDADLAGGLGWLYGLNTLGATVGCLLTGFWMIWTLGVPMSSGVGAGANLLAVALAAILLWRLPRPPVPTEPPDGPGSEPDHGSPAWLVVFFVSGAISMGVEMLLTRLGALALVNTHLVVFSFVLGGWLMGLSVGGVLGGILLQRVPARRLYGTLQLLAGALVLAVPLVRRLAWLVEWPSATPGLWRLGNLTLFCADAVWLGVASLACGLIFGALFVPANRLYLGRLRLLGSSVGAVVCVITLGGIAGSLLTGFLLMPAISAQDALLVGGAACVGLGLAVLGSTPGVRAHRNPGLLAAVLAATAAVAALAWWIPDHEFLPRYEPYREVLFYRDGRSTTDAVVVNMQTGETQLIPNGEPPGRGMDVGTWLPGLLHPAPARVALLAFATGGNIEPLLRDPAVRELVCVELSDNQLEAARHLQTGRALAALDDPRFTFVSNDARNFLLTNAEPFDHIYNDTAAYSAYMHLASHDFLELVRSNLIPGGIYTTKLHHILLSDDELATVIRTFQEVFPVASMWARHPGDPRLTSPFLVLVGLNGEQPASFETVSRGMVERGAARRWGVDRCSLLERFLAGPSGLTRMARGGRLLDDLHPVATPDVAWRHTDERLGGAPPVIAPSIDTWTEAMGLMDPGEWFGDLREGTPCSSRSAGWLLDVE